MKPYILVAALTAALNATAQDTYINHQMTRTTDLFGSARFVGMGGATGALGADISSISLNPAGIGLYRRSDMSFTAGFRTQADHNTYGAQATHGSFDQIGGVMSFNTDNDGMKYVNFAINYQCKADFRHTFIGDCNNTAGTSITDQIINVAEYHGFEVYDDGTFYMPSKLTSALFDAYAIDLDQSGKLYNPNSPTGKTEFLGTTSGGLHAFDINLSANHNDRFYWGLTLGIDYLNYKENIYYTEYARAENMDLQAWKRVNGCGVNGKFGIILRPLEESPFRIGFTVESPTIYKLRMDATDDVQLWHSNNGNTVNTTYGNYSAGLDYNLISPWRLRASAGYTVGKRLAIGADYEYALYNRTRVSYGDYYNEYYDSWDSTDKDLDLNNFTNNTLNGVHNIRLGAELKLDYNISLRAGYNYYSNAFKPEAYLAHDPSDAVMSEATTTHYTNARDAHIATVGVGYKYRKMYVDIAYKYRYQRGDFYAFENTQLPPVAVNLDTHQLFCTLGYKF